ncbi:MAG: hypothetical protein HGA65_07045, partial [Oscillochloris sp.]|nr:hypothetical protein [Oscillochloris sp.]
EATLAWDSTGFSGAVVIRAEADLYDRLDEVLETNNQASGTLTILTRPDLNIGGLDSPETDLIATQPANIPLVLRNDGGTSAGSQGRRPRLLPSKTRG